MTVYGDGTQSRDFTYTTNVIRANLLAMTAPNAPGKIFNVANGERTSMLDLIKTLFCLTKKTVDVNLRPKRVGDVLHSHADILQAEKNLGYQPICTVEEGLRGTIEYFRKEIT